jgi:hypothetical protein
VHWRIRAPYNSAQKKKNKIFTSALAKKNKQTVYWLNSWNVPIFFIFRVSSCRENVIECTRAENFYQCTGEKEEEERTVYWLNSRNMPIYIYIYIQDFFLLQQHFMPGKRRI